MGNKKFNKKNILAVVLLVAMLVSFIVDNKSVTADVSSSGEVNSKTDSEDFKWVLDSKKNQFKGYVSEDVLVYACNLMLDGRDWEYIAKAYDNWGMHGINNYPYYVFDSPDIMLRDIYGDEVIKHGKDSYEVRKCKDNKEDGFANIPYQSSVNPDTNSVKVIKNDLVTYNGISLRNHILSDGTIAICSDHLSSTQLSGNTLTKINPALSEDTLNKIKKLIYYGYGGPDPIGTNSAKDFMCTTLGLSYLKGTYGGTPPAWVITYVNNILNNLSIPSNVDFGINFWADKNDIRQELVTWWIKEKTTDLPKIGIEIKKYGKLSDTSTQFHNAIFNVYDLSGNFITSIKDTGNKNSTPVYKSDKVLEQNKTYKIIETKAPDGCYTGSENAWTFTANNPNALLYKTVNISNNQVYSNLKFVKISNLTKRSIGETSGGAKYKLQEYSIHDNKYHDSCEIFYNGDTAKNRANHNVYSLNSNVKKIQYKGSGNTVSIDTGISFDEKLKNNEVNTKLYYTPHNQGKFRIIEVAPPQNNDLLNGCAGYLLNDEYIDFTISSEKIETVDLSKDWNAGKSTGKVFEDNVFINLGLDKLDLDTKNIIKEKGEFVVQENVSDSDKDLWMDVCILGYNLDDNGNLKTGEKYVYSLSYENTQEYHGTNGKEVVCKLEGKPKEAYMMGNILNYYRPTRLFYTEYNKGRFRVVERKAPKGYKDCEGKEFLINEENKNKLVKITLEDELKGFLKITKTDGISGDVLSGAKLQLRDITGVDDSKKDFDYLSAGKEVMTWVSGMESFVIKGLKEGKYVLIELETPKDNEMNYLNIKPYVFERKNSEDEENLNLKNYPQPKISTTAYADGKKSIDTKGEVNLTDTISFSNLIVGRKYKIKGYIVNKDTSDYITDINGEKVESEMYFYPEESNGKVDMTYHFWNMNLNNTTLVVFEELYDVSEDGEETLLVSHKDLEDTDQSVSISYEEEITETTEETTEETTLETEVKEERTTNETITTTNDETTMITTETTGKNKIKNNPKTGDDGSGLIILTGVFCMVIFGVLAAKKSKI